jgi:hypothetical protein
MRRWLFFASSPEGLRNKPLKRRPWKLLKRHGSREVNVAPEKRLRRPPKRRRSKQAEEHPWAQPRGGGGQLFKGKVSPFSLSPTHEPTLGRNAFNRLKEDIATHGIQEPIKFVEHNGRKFVVDGHHRLRIAKELGIREVPVEQVNLPFRGYKTIDDLMGP